MGVYKRVEVSIPDGSVGLGSNFDPYSVFVSDTEAEPTRSASDEDVADDEFFLLSFQSAHFYRSAYFSDALSVLLSLMTVGVVVLIGQWMPSWISVLRFWLLVSPDDVRAEHVVLRSRDGIVSVADVHTVNLATGDLIPLWACAKEKVRWYDSAAEVEPILPAEQRYFPGYILARLFFLSSPTHRTHEEYEDSPEWESKRSVAHSSLIAASPPLLPLYTTEYSGTLLMHTTGLYSDNWALQESSGIGMQKDVKMRVFVWREERFWVDGEGKWRRRTVELSRTYGALHEMAVQCAADSSATEKTASCPSLQARRRATYGPNILNVQASSFGALVMKEVLTPFFIFQMAAVIRWLFDYVVYAWVILILTVVTLLMTAFETWKNLRTLELLAASETTVRRVSLSPTSPPVVTPTPIPSSLLLPGDVVVVEAGMVLPADLVLLTGRVVVNEAMLTGETFPVPKHGLPLLSDTTTAGFSMEGERDSQYRLMAGTSVLQATPPMAHHDPQLDTRPSPSVCYLSFPMPLAMVAATGFGTQKGKLIRAIVFPRPAPWNFERNLYVFLLNLIVLFALVSCFTLYVQMGQRSLSAILWQLTDLVTVMVPPVLPLALALSLGASRERLKKKGLRCLTSARILSGGRVNCVALDKTGTLTEMHLKLQGICTTKTTTRGGAVELDPLQTEVEEAVASERCMKLCWVLAACHSLVGMEGEGRVAGEALEVELFARSRWQLASSLRLSPNLSLQVDTVVQPPPGCAASTPSLGIVRRLPFDTHLRRMSVVVIELPLQAHPKLWLLCKGAAESVAEKCMPSSLPPTLSSHVHHLSLQGRVLATAVRLLEGISLSAVGKMPREELECSLLFAGVLLLENCVKKGGKEVVEEVGRAGIRPIMVTGDHPLTALAVAAALPPLLPPGPAFLIEAGEGEGGCTVTHVQSQQRCQLAEILLPKAQGDIESGFSLPPQSGVESYSLTVTGAAFEVLLANHRERGAVPHSPSASFLESVVVRASCFARMSADAKRHLMHCLQRLDYSVAMVGDGANDSGALKAADIGVSIGSGSGVGGEEGECSAPTIAAPFSTPTADITPLIALLCEGRAALVNATTVFKFIFFYSVAQATAEVVLYRLFRKLSQNQSLLQDLIVVALVYFMPRMEPAAGLANGWPEGNLLSTPILLSVYGQSAILVGFQFLAQHLLQSQPWYASEVAPTVGLQPSAAGTVGFIMATLQIIFIAMAMVQTFGLFRRSAWTNWGLLLAFTVSLLCTTSIYFYFLPFLCTWLGMTDLGAHWHFQVYIFCIAILNGLLCILFERYFIRHVARDPPAFHTSSSPTSKSYNGGGNRRPRFERVRLESDPLWSNLKSCFPKAFEA